MTASIRVLAMLSRSDLDYLVLDDTTAGVLDSAQVAPDYAWTDITEYVRTFATDRGRQRPTEQYASGSMQISVESQTRRFDPTYLDGPYVAGGVSSVSIGMPMRLQGIYNSTTYDIFTGYVTDISLEEMPNALNRGSTITTFTCADAKSIMEGIFLPEHPEEGAGELSSERVTRVLNATRWLQDYRVIDGGYARVIPTVYGQEASAEAAKAEAAEGGALFVDATGNVVFKNRMSIFADDTSNLAQHTFGDGGGVEIPYMQYEVDVDDTLLYNEVRFKRVLPESAPDDTPEPEDQVAVDEASKTKYQLRVLEGSDFINLYDSDLKSLAEFLVGIYAEPEVRVQSLLINLRNTEAQLRDLIVPAVLSLQLRHRVVVKRRPAGTGTITREYFIEGIEHEGSENGWTVRFRLSDAAEYATNWFVLNSARLGVLDTSVLGRF